MKFGKFEKFEELEKFMKLVMIRYIQGTIVRKFDLSFKEMNLSHVYIFSIFMINCVLFPIFIKIS